MNKSIVILTTLGIFAIILCFLVFHTSCKKEVDCSDCQLTNDQIALMIYTQNQKVLFKNDATNITDTLFVGSIYYEPPHCSSPCDFGTGAIMANFTFSQLSPFCFLISSGEAFPFAQFDGSYSFNLNSSTQYVIINGTTYNDVCSIISNPDSVTIRKNGDQSKVPWKILYSKSKGFIRFYMLNGQTISKL